MSKSKRSLMIISSAVAPLLLGASVFGGVTVSLYDGSPSGYTGGGLFGDFPTSPTPGDQPTSQVGTTPIVDTTFGGESYDGYDSFGSPVSGGTGSSVGVQETIGPKDVEAETFATGATGYNLGEIALVLGGGATTESIHLFQLTSNTTGTSTGYNLSTAEVGHDLLGNKLGLTFTYNGSSAYDINEFVFTGNDEVYLQPNTEYAIELWNTGTGTNYIARNSSNPAYPGGQNYADDDGLGQSDNSTDSRGQVSGSNGRNLVFAVYAGSNNSVWTGAAGDSSWDTGGLGGNWAGPGTTTATSGSGGPGAFGSTSGVPTNAGDGATFAGVTANTTVDLNGSHTVGDLSFDEPGFSYTIVQGSGGTLSLSEPGLPAQISDYAGNHTIDVPLSIATANGVNISVGQATNILTISGAISGTAGGGLTLGGVTNVQAVGTVVLSGNNTYNGATTVVSGTLVVGAGTALPTGNALTIGGASTNPDTTTTTTTSGLVQLGLNIDGTRAVSLSSLNIVNGSTLDVGNNHFYLSDPGGPNSSTDVAIRAYLTAGYNGGAWNGTSATSGVIITSAPTSIGSYTYSIGYADGADGKVSDLPSGELEVAYTLAGDANLDGKVNSVDLGILAANFGASGDVWDQGNFNYDPSGKVNSVDLGILAGNFGQSAGGNADVVTAADWAALDAFAAANGVTLANVPEPAITGLMVVGVLGVLRRRSRSRRA